MPASILDTILLSLLLLMLPLLHEVICFPDQMPLKCIPAHQICLSPIFITCNAVLKPNNIAV